MTARDEAIEKARKEAWDYLQYTKPTIAQEGGDVYRHRELLVALCKALALPVTTEPEREVLLVRETIDDASNRIQDCCRPLLANMQISKVIARVARALRERAIVRAEIPDPDISVASAVADELRDEAGAAPTQEDHEEMLRGLIGVDPRAIGLARYASRHNALIAAANRFERLGDGKQ